MSSSEQDVDDHDAGVVRTGPDTIRDLLEQEEPWTDLRKDLVQAVVQLDLDGASLDALTGSSARDTGLQPSRAFAGNVESKPFQSPVLSPSSQNIDAANEGTVTRYSLLEFPRHPVTDDLFEADPNEEVRSARGYRHLRLEGALLVGLIQRTLRGTGRVLLVVRKSPAALDARSRFDKPEDLMLSAYTLGRKISRRNLFRVSTLTNRVPRWNPSTPLWWRDDFRTVLMSAQLSGRSQLLWQAAAGLKYLHDLGLPHILAVAQTANLQLHPRPDSTVSLSDKFASEAWTPSTNQYFEDRDGTILDLALDSGVDSYYLSKMTEKWAMTIESQGEVIQSIHRRGRFQSHISDSLADLIMLHRVLQNDLEALKLTLVKGAFSADGTESTNDAEFAGNTENTGNNVSGWGITAHTLMLLGAPELEDHLKQAASWSAVQKWSDLDTNNKDTIRDILKLKECWIGIEAVEPKSLAHVVMNVLQSEIDETREADDPHRTTCIKCIHALSKHYDILPTDLYIPKSALLEKVETHSGGFFSDIWRGRLSGCPHWVCLKRLRIHVEGQFQRERVVKAFCREALIWRHVRHENILPFYGVSEDIFPSGLCLVLPWMEHGDIHHFLGKNPQHDRRGWILDVASGMRYLHNLDPCIIHKDIRGANILVGDNHRCYLADFGISFLIETQMPGTATRSRGNIRWLPPELVVFDAKPDVGLLRQADIYSFGCTVIEIYSGHPPYSDLPTDAAIVNRISQKERPPHPSFDELPPGLWYTVVFRCLSPLPQDRPLGDEIIRCLWDLDEDYLTQYLEVCKSGPSPTYTPR